MSITSKKRSVLIKFKAPMILVISTPTYMIKILKPCLNLTNLMLFFIDNKYFPWYLVFRFEEETFSLDVHYSNKRFVISTSKESKCSKMIYGRLRSGFKSIGVMLSVTRLMQLEDACWYYYVLWRHITLTNNGTICWITFWLDIYKSGIIG